MSKTASGLSPATLRTAVAKANSVPELKQIVDYAQTAVEACKRTKRSIAETNEYAVPALEAVVKAGDLLAVLERGAPGRPKKGETGSPISPYVEALGNAGLERRTAQLWQEAARQAERLPQYLDGLGDDEVASWRGLLKGSAHVANNSGENEWYTPADYIAAAVAVMGGIDLDPASTAEANRVVGAKKFYTEKQDGLKHGWGGRVWMNPPYARPLIDQFCGKLAEEYAAGNVSQACVLTNNATETGWFHALAEVAAGIAFPRHRVRFWHPARQTTTPLQGQAVIYMGGSLDAFRAEFVRFGFTVEL
jgi:phage N-6-adenine-methyltransferase